MARRIALEARRVGVCLQPLRFCTGTDISEANCRTPTLDQAITHHRFGLSLTPIRRPSGHEDWRTATGYPEIDSEPPEKRGAFGKLPVRASRRVEVTENAV